MTHSHTLRASFAVLLLLVGGTGAGAEPLIEAVGNSQLIDRPIIPATSPERSMWGVVTGQVVDPDGKLVAGARVTRLGQGGGEATTDEFGEFRLELTHDATGPISVVIEKHSGTEVLHSIEQVYLTRDGDHADLPGVELRSSCEPQWTEGLITGPSGTDSAIYAFAVYDDLSGSGPALYAGGIFSTIGGVLANNVAKWDGALWTALGSGVDGGIYALAVVDDGSSSGPALYVGGGFSIAGGVNANNIAKWDGSTWSPLGGGLGSDFDFVLALTALREGSGTGSVLCAGGYFRSTFVIAGEIVTLVNVAKWDGLSWSPLGSGLGDSFSGVWALTEFDDASGSGSALYAGEISIQLVACL